MMNTKRNRGGRMNSGGIRPDKRKTYQHQDRPRSGSQMNYNEKNVNNDSGHKNIYMNERFIHVVLSLVGCVVQVQVKAGSLYEGILWTCSENGDIVLEMAHKVGDYVSSNHPLPHIPSRESVADKIIINRCDIVTVSVSNVDLDYAVRDNFTDIGISKCNGEVKDSEMRQLKPWECEGGDERALVEVDNSSTEGWDADIMFDTNNRQFSVGTSYDDSLEQYTTKLNKENTEEYRRREEEAQKLAAEIEGGDQHKHRVEIENNDGDDEEETFIAVVRPNESQTTGAGGSSKYVPPNKQSPIASGGNTPREPLGGSPSASAGNMLRQSIGGFPSVVGDNLPRQSIGRSPNIGGGNMSRQSTGGSPSGSGGNMPRQPSGGSPSVGIGNMRRQSKGESHSVVGSDKSKPSSGGNVQLNLARSHSNSQQLPLSPSVVESVSGDEQNRLVVPVSMARPTVRTSLSSERGAKSLHENKQEHPTHGKKSQKGRHQQIIELKEFSSNFKLDENADTSKDKDISKDRDKKKDHEKDLEVRNRSSPSGVVQKKDSVNEHQAIDNLDKKECVVLEKQKDASLEKQVQDTHDAVLDESHSDNVSKQSLSLSTEQRQDKSLRESLSPSTELHQDRSLHESLSPSTELHQDRSLHESLSPSTELHQDRSLHESLSPSTELHQDRSLHESLSPSTELHQDRSLIESQSELAVHSKLNPDAKVFSPKSFQQQSPPQMPTLPHPQTNSPSMPSHLMMNLHPQPILPAAGQQYMVPAMVISSNGSQKSYSVMPKRAIVSVNSDYNSSAVQAATGQPLLAQNTPPAVGSYMFFQQMIPPQPTGYQLGQMMPMPQPMRHRFISPTSIHGAPPSMQPGGPGMDQNSPALQAGQMYLATHAQQGPMAAHMSQAAHFTAHPGHLPHVVANNTNNQQQNSPMIPPVPPGGASEHHHPAPSPVNMQNQPPINPGPHPQPSGTPQPHPGYPQGLAPSPHNPSSPQNIPIYPYTPIGHPSMQMQVSSGGQQFPMPQHGGVPTSVAYNMNLHTHHATHMPQLYMVPPHPMASGPMNPHIQIPGHPMMGPGSIQSQMMSHTAVPGQQGQNHGQGQHPTHHMQYTPQVHSAGGQPYQPTQ